MTVNATEPEYLPNDTTAGKLTAFPFLAPFADGIFVDTRTKKEDKYYSSVQCKQPERQEIRT